MSESSTPWAQDVAVLNPLSPETISALRRVEEYQRLWQEYVKDASADDLEERRQRSLRRHAIETGIIERLYEISWGVTEELVAEGISHEVAEREGELTEDTLATLNAQLDALQLLTEFVRDGRDLSVSFVKEIHAAITVTQEFYDARDQFGHQVQIPLPRGTWKTADNHVRRGDGSLLEYTPAIHVSSQMDELLWMYEEYTEEGVQPLALAAWLHHRFIRIHPFADGNGRVARALTLLVLLKHSYTPLVVRREHREEYIEALDAANDGDTGPLIRFFAMLEQTEIVAELEFADTRSKSSAVVVAEEYAKKLKAKLEFSDSERRRQSEELAKAVQAQIISFLDDQSNALKAALSAVDPHCESWLVFASPPDPKAKHWRREIFRAARALDIFTNMDSGTWWTMLNVKLRGQHMRFLVTVQKVGRGESGILAVSHFAESVVTRDDRDTSADLEQGYDSLIRTEVRDMVSMVHTDSTEDVVPQILDVTNKLLAASTSAFLSGVS